ncbi:N-acetylmuramoyl-L-alanine amidase, partial [Oceanospirillum multiglobuliferum]
MAYTVKQQIRQGLPQVGVKPYRQVHAHSTGNPNSTAQNEADYHDRRPVESGFFQYVVGDGVAIQTAPLNMGAYDVGGGWNAETFAAVELIESHKTRAEFERDYAIYCELLRDLANKGGIPVTLDTNDLAGIKTHNYCTHHQPNNFSDHVDPLPYLAKWGITLEQFRNDVCNSITSKTTTAEEQTIQKKKVGDIMLLFRNENSAEVYWLIGNKYT